jgi:cytochrome c peroxidase
MKPAVIILLLLGLLTTSLIRRPAARTIGVETAITYFKKEGPVFAAHCTDLQKTIRTLDLHDPRSLQTARQKLRDCRAAWKRIEPFLEYFFKSSSRIYNRAPKFEAEEPGMEYQSPLGLQVIETLLYETEDPDRKRQLVEQSSAVASSASDLLALLYGFHANDKQILESLRVELVRIITMDITGYDAPYLKTGITEAAESLLSIEHQLAPYEPDDGVQSVLRNAIEYCKVHADFNTFDRCYFLKYYALPLQHRLSLFIQEKGLQLNTNKILNYDADNIFSPEALIISDAENAGLIPEGQKFFSDKTLSGNGTYSCASCHAPEKMFADGVVKPMALDGHSRLDRNAPTLLYAGLQHRQFWDGRANTLEEQIVTVLKDPREMHTGLNDTTLASIARSVAAYVSTLNPMNSAFDRYIRGDTGSWLSPAQIRGANLFMGKAQCATCHFIPVFNGLIPPDYAVTEFEVLGVTRTDDLSRPRADKDQGRYNVYPFPFYKGAFKTPTVRNSALTGPYMHNGAFRTLESVMDFYNRGGARGLGLDFPSQTLSPQPLHLSKQELQDIIQFLHALTDRTEHT